MIVLVTGQPGSGKTAYVVDWLLDQQKERPLFVMGIPELKIEHQPVPPVIEWTEERQSQEDPDVKLSYFTFPQSSIVVIDEAQRVFRPRPVGSAVPPYVAAFETHRHLGIDFVLITQSPNLMDMNLRRLIGKHVHIRVLPVGRRIYEWTELGEPEFKASRDLASSKSYKLPKRAYDYYKSAELHTKINVSIPWYYYLLVISVIAFIAFAWRSYRAVSGKVSNSDTPLPSSPVSSQSGKSSSSSDPFAAQKPRIAGLLHTAPAYDQVTLPKEAPVPVACYLQKRSGNIAELEKLENYGQICSCLDQKGNVYKTSFQICSQIAQSGFFDSWSQNQKVVNSK